SCPVNEVSSTCVIPCNDCQTKGKCNFLVCNKGCDCKKGFYRSYGGICIPENACPPSNQSCGKREVYKTCGSACPPTCSNRGKNQICTLQCVTGCFCQEGLVRNDRGECVNPKDCPQSPQGPQGPGGPPSTILNDVPQTKLL
ncbi:zonadhesin, partial [Nephila pilipes]